MTDSIEDAIERNALGPQSSSHDGESVSRHSLREQIAADRYLASKRAATGKGPGIRMFKICPPGTA